LISSRDEPELPVLEDARPQHVAGEQVGRALDACEVETERLAERARQERLANARDVLDEDVAAGEQGDSQQPDRIRVDDDRSPDRVGQIGQEALARRPIDRVPAGPFHSALPPTRRRWTPRHIVDRTRSRAGSFRTGDARHQTDQRPSTIDDVGVHPAQEPRRAGREA